MAEIKLNERISRYKKEIVNKCFLSRLTLGKPLMCLDFLLCLYLGLFALDDEKLGENYLLIGDAEYYISAKMMLEDFNDERRLDSNIMTLFNDFDELENFSYAVGKAYSLKMAKKRGKVFLFLDAKNFFRNDFWGNVMLGSRLDLHNLVVVLFNNDGKYIFADKFKGFEWQFLDIKDGHDYDQIFDGLSYVWSAQRKPICMSIDTLPAKGIPFLEGKDKAFYASLSEEEYEELKRLEIC